MWPHLMDWYELVDQKLVSLLAGENRLAQPIAAVCVAERPGILTEKHPGELVFVSGVALPKQEELLRLVRNAISAECAGIVIQVGKYIKHIPQDIIFLCKKAEMPLFSAAEPITMERLMLTGFQVTEEKRTLRYTQEDTLRNVLSAPTWSPSMEAALQKEGFLPQAEYRAALIHLPSKEHGGKMLRDWIERSDGVPAILLDDMLVCVYQDGEFPALVSQIDAFSALFHTAYMIGDAYPGFAGLYHSYVETRNLLRLQLDGHIPRELHLRAEANIYRIVEQLEHAEILDEICARYYTPLETSDLQNGTDYLEFTQYFLKCDGQTREIAQQLGIHRNTVLYKVRRIEALLNCKLQRADAKFYLTIASCAGKRRKHNTAGEC